MVRFTPRTQFKILSTHNDVPSLTRNGKEIWELLFERDRDKGGYFSEISGLMGSGKTSLMFTMADKTIKENPLEKCFLREPEGTPSQFPKLKCHCEVYRDARYPLTIYETVPGEPLHPVDDIPVHPFRGVQELLKRVKPGQMNVVFFKPDELWHWSHLLDRLRLNADWQSCFWDEAEDCFPLNAAGKYYEMNQRFSNSAKQIRKSRVNLTYNSQSSSDVDWRLRRKVQVWFYLRGSRVDMTGPVYQGAISKLSVGQCYVDFMHGQFGVLRFGAYKPGVHEYVVLPDKDGG